MLLQNFIFQLLLAGGAFHGYGSHPALGWGSGPNTDDLARYPMLLLWWFWIETALLSHLQAIRGERAYKELFEKMAEDIGFMRRSYEKI